MADAFLIPEPIPPRLLSRDMFATYDLEVDALLDVPRARSNFRVDGSGLSVAVLDTGLRVTHNCFAGRVKGVRNFTEDDGGDPSNVTDRNGHGTNVSGIIVGGTNDERRGIAPASGIVALKVLPARTLTTIFDALQWVHDNADSLNITVANLSVGVPGVNDTDDSRAKKEYRHLSKLLDALVAKRIAVVAAAGNSYFRFQQEGMSFPAINRQVISVGAVYDTSFGPRTYGDGSTAFSTHADQITPFSQRLSKEVSPDCYTDIFSAGGAATSAGANDDDATSIQDGTSQAAPTIAGIVLLMQQYYLRMKGVLPPIPLLQEVLRASSTWIVDGDDEDDNVKNSNRKYPRVNAFQSLAALHKAIQLDLA